MQERNSFFLGNFFWLGNGSGLSKSKPVDRTHEQLFQAITPSPSAEIQARDPNSERVDQQLCGFEANLLRCLVACMNRGPNIEPMLIPKDTPNFGKWTPSIPVQPCNISLYPSNRGIPIFLYRYIGLRAHFRAPYYKDAHL